MRTPELSAAAEGGQSQLPVHATVANDAAKIDPALHPPDTQSAAESLPAGELDPAGQSLQAPDPSVALYLPATQSVQAAADPATDLYLPAAQAATLDPEPVNPASAVQSPSASEPEGLPELSGQSMHVSDV